MGLFITFEGGEGCGKSSQSRVLHDRLSALRVPTLLTHEPGGTQLGEQLTGLLKWHRTTKLSGMSELLLFCASRNHLCEEVLIPSLNKGLVVICDRYVDSSIAYQGYGRGIDIDTVIKLCDLSSGQLKPDLTFLLDMPVEQGLARKKSSRHDRFESEEIAFHQRVRDGFLQLAQREATRFMVIDASLSKPDISEIIWQKVSPMLKL